MDTQPHDDALNGHLHALRSEMAQLDAPPGVESALMAAFARQHQRRRWFDIAPRRAVAGAGALAMLAVAALVVLKTPAPLASDGGSEGGGVFIALDSLERIESEAHPRMIETEVPRMELASLGVPVTPDNAGDTVRAEMLVSADGEPLALRLSATE